MLRKQFPSQRKMGIHISVLINYIRRSLSGARSNNGEVKCEQEDRYNIIFLTTLKNYFMEVSLIKKKPKLRLGIQFYYAVTHICSLQVFM